MGTIEISVLIVGVVAICYLAAYFLCHSAIVADFKKRNSLNPIGWQRIFKPMLIVRLATEAVYYGLYQKGLYDEQYRQHIKAEPPTIKEIALAVIKRKGNPDKDRLFEQRAANLFGQIRVMRTESSYDDREGMAKMLERLRAAFHPHLSISFEIGQIVERTSRQPLNRQPHLGGRRRSVR